MGKPSAADTKDGSSKKSKKAKLPPQLQEQRDYVVCTQDLNYNTSIPTSANVYMPLGVDNAWNFEEFTEGFRVDVSAMSAEEMTFDMVGIDPSLANALRRILIAEVPTVAIEHVFIVNNTSIMPDEMLAHRLGLVPLAVDPRLFEMRLPEEAANEKNTLVLKLDVTCSWQPGGHMANEKVTSGMLQWLPGGSEMPDETSVRFASDQAAALPRPAAPVHDDILLMRLRPGQQLQLEAHCAKGIGRDHAKFSPVATAWYRLLPEVLLTRRVMGSDADELAAELPGLVTVQGSGESREAVVGEARKHDKVLEKVRRLSSEERWAGAIQLRKRKDHFIFTVQSAGALPSDVLLEESLRILAEKCDNLLRRL